MGTFLSGDNMAVNRQRGTLSYSLHSTKSNRKKKKNNKTNQNMLTILEDVKYCE